MKVAWRQTTNGKTQLPRLFEGMETEIHSPSGSLPRDLSSAVNGEVRFDDGSRAAYSTDSSNYRQVPLGVVVPKSTGDVVAAVEVCRRHGVPVTSRGGGTSLAGQACNSGVVIDYSKYLNRVRSVDPETRTAVVEPGCVLDTLRESASQYGLTFGPDPATHDRNTLGGMLGNNSCGIHSVQSDIYGTGPMTVHQVLEMEVLTYEGRRMTVGATAPEELEAIVDDERDPRADIYGRLRRIRDTHADEIRRRYPDIPRRASGYNLDWLLPENGFHVARSLVGSEGTCVVILSATVHLVEQLPERTLVVLGYPDAASAADHVPEILQYRPVGLEGIDATLVGYMEKKGMHPADVEMLPEGGGWLLVEFGADTDDDAIRQAQRLADDLTNRADGPNVALFEESEDAEKIWDVRESGLGATAHVPGTPRTHPGWEDAAVPPDRLGDYLRAFQQLLQDFEYEAALYGHYGQGCVHCRIDFDLATEEGVAAFRQFLDRAADLVVSHGGSISGEHGDGQARAALLGKMFGSELVEAFQDFKTAWDPEGKMNPGKIVDPRPPDADLREGPGNRPREVRTHFAFRDDGGSFAAATARCVGVGECRDVRSGTMCPSYMATLEEEHSTRGRARLLYEMLQGNPINDGWRSEGVKRALDLCLACKGCKTECPVNVDMATYKAEFLSHYYEGRLRPRVAYSMGLIYWWSRWATRLSGIANFLSRTSPSAALLKWVAGVAPERQIPTFSQESFRRWFDRHDTQKVGPTHRRTSAHRPGLRPRGQRDRRGPQKERGSPDEKQSFPAGRVLLWPDTFNNFFDSAVARSAVRVLETAGYRVEIPDRPLCCGRPLYDWGMLDRAKGLWRQTIQTLTPWLEDGVPVVGLEPSCVAAFKDELPNLFPDDPAASKLAESTHLLGELLAGGSWGIPRMERRAIVQGHCHHKAVMGMESETAVLDRMRLDYEVLDSGCCGMAGSFGFEARHYDVSLRVGERVLLPRVRRADPDTLIVANGFSCREQIAQTTNRGALHLAQVIELAMEYGPEGPRQGPPERALPAHQGASRAPTN